jgi:hypothetical protein
MQYVMMPKVFTAFMHAFRTGIPPVLGELRGVRLAIESGGNKDVDPRVTPSQEWKEPDISSVQVDWRFQNAWERLQGHPYGDLSKGNVNALPSLARTRESGGVSGARSCSRDADGILDRVRRKPSLGIITPVLQDEGDGSCEVLLALINRFTLTVRTRNLRTIPDVPFSIALDYRGKLIM